MERDSLFLKQLSDEQPPGHAFPEFPRSQNQHPDVVWLLQREDR